MYGVGRLRYGVAWSLRNWTAVAQDCRDIELKIELPAPLVENEQLVRDVKRSFLTHFNARKFAGEDSIWLRFHAVERDGS